MSEGSYTTRTTLVGYQDITNLGLGRIMLTDPAKRMSFPANVRIMTMTIVTTTMNPIRMINPLRTRTAREHSQRACRTFAI